MNIKMGCLGGRKATGRRRAKGECDGVNIIKLLYIHE
jgi:hypothetical protein